MTRRPLDQELVHRGLAASRSDAQAAIRRGTVTVSGAPATKPATLVSREQPIAIAGVSRRFVSRGGEKLRHALDRFGIDPSGRDCVDVGASTGGFTDCLLKAGAARIACIDVGYGQLAWELREDPRVVVLERRNARELRPGDLPFTPSLVVADLSFISLRFVLPALARVADSKAEFVLLVKPQFEAGRDEVEKGGVVRDPIVRRRTIEEVAASCRGLGISPQGVTQSPLTGPAGNVEFLVHAIAGRKERPLDLDAAVSEGR